MSDFYLQQQFDQYTLEALLGRGGMARVYRGWDTDLHRHAAIKIIDTPFYQEPTYLERFRREAQAIAALTHPHIVTIYHIGQVNEVMYMAMQYVEGADLAQILANHRQQKERLAPKEALRMAVELCLALDYAHQKKIIHRDVKPSNVLIDKEGRAILGDFGLALLTEMGTRGEVFGSPHYMAPEQAVSSARAVPQSDLYSVGVILYEMFTGVLPFDADEPVEVALKHLQESVPPPRVHNPQISEKVEQIIFKALAKEPQQRYPSGKAMAEALKDAMQEEKPPAARASMAHLVAAVYVPATIPLKLEDMEPPVPRKFRLRWGYFWSGAGVALLVLLRELIRFFV